MHPCARLTLLLAFAHAAALAGGCSFGPLGGRGKSPLSQMKPGIEASTLEVVFVRHRYELPAMNEELWQEIDETPIPAGVRKALAQNGLRAGVVSETLPAGLAAALSGETVEAAADGEASASESPLGKLESEPLVRRRTLQAMPGQRAELLASGVYEQLPLLVRERGEVRGETYAKAQALFAVKAQPTGDGRVRLAVVPEVHYGEQQQKYAADDGVFRLESSRPKVALEQMGIEVVLSRGQSIVLGTRPDRAGSVGHYFFTEPQGGQLEQKLMLIRFEGTKYDNLLLTSSGNRVERED
jgi:hypothetical protein